MDVVSKQVQQLTNRINTKSAKLAPIIRELRPLRQKVQVCLFKLICFKENEIYYLFIYLIIVKKILFILLITVF